MSSNFSIINHTRIRISRLPLLAIKQDILGKNYSLSVAFVDEKNSQKINKKYRGKNKPTNVLSFVFSKTNGELILCPSLIKKESQDKSKNFGKTFRKLFGFLVIHGMLHLKGFEHSSTMSKLEEKYDQKYFSRHRRGLKHDQGGGGRISKRRKNS